jgi:hypothetical protein
MADVTYVFGDVITGQILQEIPLYGVSMTRGLGRGDFRASFQLDQTGKDNRDLIAATLEGRCYVVCERGGQPVWDGFVVTRTYQSQAKVFQLYCKSWEHYPEYRLMRTDFEAIDEEQRNIFRDLWLDLMSTPNTPQITIPSSFDTVVTKSIDVKSFEYKDYRAPMDAIANGFDGFDWTIDTARVGGAYQRSLRIGYPALGATIGINLEYPGNILNYWQNDSLSGRGTNIYGIGAGEGSTMLVQEVIHSDLLSGGFPRFDVKYSFKSVNDAELLADLTMQAAIVGKATVPTLTVELKANLEPEFGGYGLGDAAQIYIDDPRHPDPVDRTFNTRIIGWEYYPPSSEKTEEVRLAFQGSDL